MNLRRWIWLYLSAGSSFTIWALVYYGGATLLILALAIALFARLAAG